MSIGEGEIAEDENGFAVGFDVASVDAVGAETRGSSALRNALILFHQRSIAQDADFALAGDFVDRSRNRLPNTLHNN